MSTLKGTKIIEIAGIGPAPFAGMLLADMGADVFLVDRNKVMAKVLNLKYPVEEKNP